MSDRLDDAGTPGSGRSRSGVVLGWVLSVLGIAVTLTTIAISAYVILSADTTKQFTALLVSSTFFAAFPALTGLGMILWGRKLVMRSRAGDSEG